MVEFAPYVINGLGAIAGAKLNHYANADLQQRQIDAQERFQERTFQMNQTAVQNQAPLQLHGMENAGLNPASVAGNGAPSVQSGSAVGASSQLGNIFDGISEIIQAAKMPTDVERTKTETAATKQSMELIVPAQVDKLAGEAASLAESTRSNKNANDAFEASDKFLREHSRFMFERLREKMKEDGTWDALLPDTKQSFDALAAGTHSLGVGEIEALKKVIDSQAQLSDADKKLVDNAFENNIKLRQWKDDDVMKAIARLPKDNQDLLHKQMSKVDADIAHIYQLINESKASEALKYAEKARVQFERESAELNDVKWLAKHGRFDDVDVKTWEQSLETVKEVGLSGLDFAKTVASGYLLGRGIGVGKSASTPAPEPSRIFPPSDRQIMKTNAPKSFGHMDFR